jgi:DNA recombination protein RmuC
MSLSTETILIFSLVVFGIMILLIYLQNRKMSFLFSELKKQDSQQLLSQWLAEMRAGMDRNTDMVTRQLSNSNDAVNQRLDSTAQLLRLLNRDLGQVHEIGQQMRDFSHFFRSPKMRGRLGESIMEELLLQVLPHSIVSVQHRFSSGSIVDALIKLEHGAISVDAKFPLENYQKSQNTNKKDAAVFYKKEFKRDVKKHIQAISGKYIVPGEGTLDFAIMYVPSNTLYYEIIADDQLIEQAEAKNVLLVSPNSFYYFLKLILAGLYSSKIEKTAALFMQHINAFDQSLKDVDSEMSTLLTHINNSHNAGQRVSNKIQDAQRKLNSLININDEK